MESYPEIVEFRTEPATPAANEPRGRLASVGTCLYRPESMPTLRNGIYAVVPFEPADFKLLFRRLSTVILNRTAAEEEAAEMRSAGR
jgi:hypothetical protein